MNGMQFKVGRPMFVYGNWKDVKNIMLELSVELQVHCNKILFIDTANSLNPHHPSFNKINQKSILNRIYCVRTPKPYDLWARLSTTESIVKHKKIEALLINSLSLLFEDSEEDEIMPLLNHILGKIDHLARKYNLITLIGNSPYEDKKVMRASNCLLSRGKTIMVV
jgi:hypothetical protein